MQTHSLYIAAVLLAFTTGCKNRQGMQGNATSETVVMDGAAAVDKAAAAPAPQDTADAVADSVLFSIERTPCFGTCPAYKLTIHRDGSATYVGRRFAPREGRYTGHVDAALRAAVLEAVEKSGFYGMEDKYDRPVTDLPSTIIRARNKQVIGRVGAPQAFKDLALEVEELLAPVEWTKVGDEP